MTQGSPATQHDEPGKETTTPAVVQVDRVLKVEISSVPTLHVELPSKPESSFWSPEWMLVVVTAVLAVITGALARYTYKLYRATVTLSADAVQSAEQQTQRMERSIAEAARAATAMEGVAEAMTQNTKLMPTLLRTQMRAYVSVQIGSAVSQDEKLRFGASPVLTNNGLTPARNVRFIAHAGILDGRNEGAPLPPLEEPPPNTVGIGARESYILQAVVPERLPDIEVPGIMEGMTRRLFCWGKVKYDDVWGDTWETNFCLNYTFYKGEDEKIKVNGWTYPRGNSAT